MLVSDEAIEIPASVSDAVRKELQKAEARRLQRWEIQQAAIREFRKLSYELQGWAPLWFSPRTSLEARKYLHDKSEGKAIQTVNHLHDKPLELNVTHSLSERFKIEMQKADQRVRDRR